MCGMFPTPYGEHETSKKGKGMVPGLKELMLCMNPERKLPENKHRQQWSVREICVHELKHRDRRDRCYMFSH